MAHQHVVSLLCRITHTSDVTFGRHTGTPHLF
jgi:hypothetical protein